LNFTREGDYKPFKTGNKVAVLPVLATLRLENNFPRLDGATALYPIYAAFVQAVYPGKESIASEWISPFTGRSIPTSIVEVNGTSEAYINLIKGEADIIFCAAPSDDQIETAKERGITYNLTPIGKEAFVFFVNSRNPISNLTTEQIKGIYTGKITNWNQVGGRNEKIIVYQRTKNSGSQTMLEQIMAGEKIIEPLTEEGLVIPFMGGIIEKTAYTADYRNFNSAIGYSFLFYTTQMVRNNGIKLLSIDGVFPSFEVIQTGKYPFADYFYAVTTNTKNKNINVFIEWILSEQGQYLIERTGYVPIR
jgi:phosphate transport system substrate-binding protein